MDMEQFLILFDTLNKAGEGAWPLALLWIGKSYFIVLVMAVLIIVVARMIVRAGVMDGVATKQLKTLRYHLDGKTFFTALEEQQVDAIVHLIIKAKESGELK